MDPLGTRILRGADGIGPGFHEFPENIIPVTGHYLHLKEHGIVLPEQSKTIGKVIRANIKFDKITALD